jgi:hypothetical protein
MARARDRSLIVNRSRVLNNFYAFIPIFLAVRQGILNIRWTKRLGTMSGMRQNFNIKVGAIAFVAIAAICCHAQPTLAVTVATNEPIGKLDVKPVNALSQYQQGLNSIAAGNFTQALANFDRAISLVRMQILVKQSPSIPNPLLLTTIAVRSLRKLANIKLRSPILPPPLTSIPNMRLPI